MYFDNSCIFSEFPLDPCDSIRGDDKALATLKKDQSSRMVLLLNGDVVMKSIAEAYLAPVTPSEKQVFLGKDEKHAYFASDLENDFKVPEDCELIDLRTIARHAVDNGFSPLPSLLARGKMLLDWHARHEFCANCGGKSKMKRGGYVRHCDACDRDHFPRVDPVVIMMIVKEGKCLLGRSPHFLPGMYSALAGFMEPGENIEEACRREVLEEAGIKVGAVHYIKSQPWPFPSSLMIGVIGEALDGDINIDADELEDAQWFSKDQIKEVLKTEEDENFQVPHKLAIARHILDHWISQDY